MKKLILITLIFVPLTSVKSQIILSGRVLELQAKINYKPCTL